jgi:hypothetical protein
MECQMIRVTIPGAHGRTYHDRKLY